MPSSIPGFVMCVAQPLTAWIGAQSQQVAPASLGRAAGSSSLVHDALRRVWRNPGAVAGAIVITAVILLAAFAPVIAPYDPIEQNSTAIRAGPSAEHLFGADNFGRDIFSRVLYGGRMSLPIGFVAIGITAVVGVALGLIAGYYGGRIDTIVMRWVDLMLAFPGILLAMSLVAILGASLFNVMSRVGIAASPEYTRVVRGAVLSAGGRVRRRGACLGSARSISCPAAHSVECAAAGDCAG